MGSGKSAVLEMPAVSTVSRSILSVGMGWQKRQLRSPAAATEGERCPAAAEEGGCSPAEEEAEGRPALEEERGPTLAGERSSASLSTSCGTARAARTARAPAAAAPAAPVR